MSSHLTKFLRVALMLTVFAPWGLAACASAPDTKPSIKERADAAGEELDEEVQNKKKQQKDESER